MRPLLILIAAVLLAPQASAQELGRLFFTPEQRAALDARRKARVPDKPAAVPQAPPSPVTRLDGYVRSSTGRATVWVNGELEEGSLGERVVPDRDGRLPVAIDTDRARVRLKPGETLDRDSGEVKDVIGDGEIRLRRSPRN